MHTLNLEQLRTLVAVVDHGTFDAAAAALNVSAPAISQRIRALEDSSGRVLVRRDKPVLPTPAGEALLRTARQMLHLEQAAEVELAAHDTGSDAGGGAGELGDEEAPMLSLPVAVNSDSLAAWFLSALAAADCGPRVLFDIRREDEAHSAELLRSGEVMAAVTSEAKPVQGCRAVPLGVMRYRACATQALAEQYGLAGIGGLLERDPTAGQQLRRERLRVMPRIDFDLRDAMQSTFYRNLTGEEPSPHSHSIPSTAEYTSAVRYGLGWGLIPEQIAHEYLDSGALVDFSPDAPHEVQLYWQHWRIRSMVLDQLTAAVTATAAAMLV